MPKSNPYSTWNEALATDDADGLPDKAIVSLVETLRVAGIVTLQSCAGHQGRADGTLWVLADAVNEASVRRLFGPPFVFIKRTWWPEERWEFIWFPWDTVQAIALLSSLSPLEEERPS